MPDDQFPDVPAAFAALIKELKAEAVRGDFERTAAFLRHLQQLESRWAAGQPPHTMRTASKKPQTPAAGPPPVVEHVNGDIG
ncbi:hypothetical protein KPL78_19285 [Roseomonas sp. HJA6]|uniref:Uncharacterized protein n=1 Tax=Roseomonas alba TaxID=2846776 RepID=A0ABS7ACW4_9PROT|nr:hypothetical protein [Neoroseomonas alba]MBW6400013.1 hypothetical protein [Neoroseomonas alba]